jgi:aminoglycoside phosphotransferase (APT) family kinase protein
VVHGDLLARNVLVEGDRISGVLDWGSACFGDPLYDAAWLLYCWGVVPAVVLGRHRGGSRAPLDPGSGNGARVPTPHWSGLDCLLHLP